MAQKKEKRHIFLPRMVLINTIVGTLAGGISGLALRLYLSRLGVLNLDWSIMVFAGMTIGFLSGFERVRFEKLQREKKSLEMELGKTDRALRTTRSRHENLLARIPDWIFQTDREFSLVESSRAFKDIFGDRWQKREKMSVFDLLPDRLHSELKRNFEEALAGKSQLLELEMDKPPGRRYFSLVLYPARDESKKTAGVGGIMRDISERKKLERELLQAEKMAEMGTMAASVAHEIRNPLGIIKTAIYNLNRRLPEKDDLVKKHVANIEQKVEEADTIVTSLLDYSRLREPVMAETNLNKLLEDALEQVGEQFSDSAIRVVKNWGNLPSIKVDRVHLSGVFQNMIKNAYEAMDEKGTLTLATAYKSESKILEISISDTGCGIHRDNREKIGKPFFSTKAKGIGLGLALSYRVVEEIHGGTVQCASEPGKGTIFTISLPVKREW